MVRSSRDKGNKHAKDFEQLLVGAGYITDRANPAISWIPDGKGGRRPIARSEDFFNAFDIVALRGDSKVLLVQVTTITEQGDATGKATERRKKIDTLLPTLPLRHVLPVVAGRRPGKNWTLWIYATAQTSGETKWWRLHIDETGQGAQERRIAELERHLLGCGVML